MPESVIRKRGEGKPLWFMGMLLDIKATAAETNGEISAMEMSIPPGPALCAPPHTHSGAEITYVLEGTLKFHVGDKSLDAGAGTLLYFPRGTLEWFENVSKSPARVLVVYAPGGMDKFFGEVGEPARSRELPPAPKGPPDFAKLSAVAKKYGLEVKPPPK